MFIYMNESVKSAGRVLDLLELLSSVLEPLGVSEVARRLGIPKSSTVGLLGTLVSRGYVVRCGALYEITPAFRQDGWVGGQVARLVRISHPVLAVAVERSGESAFLGVMTPDWKIRYIDKVVGPQEVRYDGSLDHLRPSYCTSIGHCFLAHESANDVERFLRTKSLERVASGTITDPDAIVAALARVRDMGYAESRDGHVDGASGVAAPIYGPDKEVIAGITLAAPSSRFVREYEKLIDICVWAAAEISRVLGATDGFNRAPMPGGPPQSEARLEHAAGNVTRPPNT